ncbi:MAG: hypothetical protein KGI57_08630 [Hyphomicrobiales bacterium]|nr:hypothetical protein [Hyphomicrobiales bacterium]MDE2017757.1 hypothetical protein [Hyphomicrobiales bacterium]
MAIPNYLTETDVTKMREIAKAVYENPTLLADFDRDPEAAAFQINGFRPPEGHHLHLSDDKNQFHPAEYPGRFGSHDVDGWTRDEFRVGYKTYSLVACM